jgi:hypothetical protein
MERGEFPIRQVTGWPACAAWTRTGLSVQERPTPLSDHRDDMTTPPNPCGRRRRRVTATAGSHIATRRARRSARWRRGGSRAGRRSGRRRRRPQTGRRSRPEPRPTADSGTANHEASQVGPQDEDGLKAKITSMDKIARFGGRWPTAAHSNYACAAGSHTPSRMTTLPRSSGSPRQARTVRGVTRRYRKAASSVRGSQPNLPANASAASSGTSRAG